MSAPAPADGTAVIREFLPTSPFVNHLGIELIELGDGNARLRLPFRDELATIGQVVHGGAVSTLIDTTAMAAAWAGAAVPDRLRGATVDLSVSFLAPAEGRDLQAAGSVVGRGSRLTTVRVDTHTDDGTQTAAALVTYQLG